MKRFLITVDTGFVGANYKEEVEFEDDAWEAMSEAQREGAMWGEVQEAINNNISGSWEEIA
jgi:hypothetical protein